MTKEEILLKLDNLILQAEKLETKLNNENQFGHILTIELIEFKRKLIWKKFN